MPGKLTVIQKEKGYYAVQPDLPQDAGITYQEAHADQGPKPNEPFITWIETLDELKARNYDLSARNPNQDEQVTLPLPSEITARLLEQDKGIPNHIGKCSCYGGQRRGGIIMEIPQPLGDIMPNG